MSDTLRRTQLEIMSENCLETMRRHLKNLDRAGMVVEAVRVLESIARIEHDLIDSRLERELRNRMPAINRQIDDDIMAAIAKQ